MTLIPEREQEYIRDVFKEKLKGPVVLEAYLSKGGECVYCGEALELVKELSELGNGLVSYEAHYVEDEPRIFEENRVLGPPTIRVRAPGAPYYAAFSGLPAGYEFGALLEDILDASRGSPRLSPTTVEKLRSVDRELEIMVFVTPTCPYCPRAVRMAHMFAMANPRIRGVMVEALEFPELAEKHSVMSVPHIVINDSYTFIGALPEPMFLEHVLRAARGETAYEVTEEGVSSLK
ncbi:MAG: protein disulfide oxidoreductase [Conexivisphaera sp.]